MNAAAEPPPTPPAVYRLMHPVSVGDLLDPEPYGVCTRLTRRMRDITQLATITLAVAMW